MVRIIERNKAQYESRTMEFGELYRWCPERVVLQCECGERPTLTSSVTSCDGCGTDYMIIRDELAPHRHEMRLIAGRGDVAPGSLAQSTTH